MGTTSTERMRAFCQRLTEEQKIKRRAADALRKKLSRANRTKQQVEADNKKVAAGMRDLRAKRSGAPLAVKKSRQNLSQGNAKAGKTVVRGSLKMIDVPKTINYFKGLFGIGKRSAAPAEIIEEDEDQQQPGNSSGNTKRRRVDARVSSQFALPTDSTFGKAAEEFVKGRGGGSSISFRPLIVNGGQQYQLRSSNLLGMSRNNLFPTPTVAVGQSSNIPVVDLTRENDEPSFNHASISRFCDQEPIFSAMNHNGGIISSKLQSRDLHVNGRFASFYNLNTEPPDSSDALPVRRLSSVEIIGESRSNGESDEVQVISDVSSGTNGGGNPSLSKMKAIAAGRRFERTGVSSNNRKNREQMPTLNNRSNEQNSAKQRNSPIQNFASHSQNATATGFYYSLRTTVNSKSASLQQSFVEEELKRYRQLLQSQDILEENANDDVVMVGEPSSSKSTSASASPAYQPSFDRQLRSADQSQQSSQGSSPEIVYDRNNESPSVFRTKAPPNSSLCFAPSATGQSSLGNGGSQSGALSQGSSFASTSSGLANATPSPSSPSPNAQLQRGKSLAESLVEEADVGNTPSVSQLIPAVQRESERCDVMVFYDNVTPARRRSTDNARSNRSASTTESASNRTLRSSDQLQDVVNRFQDFNLDKHVKAGREFCASRSAKHVERQQLQEEAELREKNRLSADLQRQKAKQRSQGIVDEIWEEPEEEAVVDEFRALTAKQTAMVKKAFRGGKLDEVLVEEFNILIRRRDFVDHLYGLNWLSDEIINYYMKLLVARSAAAGSKLPKVHAFNTFFFTKLHTQGYAAIKHWTKKVDVFAQDLLLVPVHLGVHWCLAVLDFRKKTIFYYDSMGGQNNTCLALMMSYLEQESLDKKGQKYDTSDWKKINLLKTVPQQKNGSDCGMFACRFAEYACRDAKINFTQKHMPYFRHRTVVEILTKKLLV